MSLCPLLELEAHRRIWKRRVGSGRAGACWELLTVFMPIPFVSDLAPVWPAKTELFATEVDFLADVMEKMEC